MNKLEDIAIKFTEWVGSIYSLITHTLLFASAGILIVLGYDFDKVLLTLTTIVSLEAIYLSIFIQMSVNRNTRAIANVEKDIDEIQEDVDEIQKDVDEIAEDVEEIAEDVEDIQETHEEIAEDIEEIQKDVDEIQKDVDEIQEDVEEIQEEVVEEDKTGPSNK